jgi:small-conductance mechanosensitive channel
MENEVPESVFTHRILEQLLEAEHLVEATAQEATILGFAARLGIAAAVVAGQILFIRLIWFLFRKLNEKIKADAGKKIKALSIKNFKILSATHIVNVIQSLLRVIKYLITFTLLFITVPIVFSQFPATQELANYIFSHLLEPLTFILHSIISFIPNLIYIIIILLIMKYILRGLKFFAKQIANGSLVVPGFYADWAWPTFHILRVFFYAFTVVLVFPYLPGSDSRVFQGVSVFLGIVFTLGSGSVIGNLVAGLVITYMRPFKIGDLIKIKDITGFVEEKSPFIVRLKNTKNESITFPNLTILASEVINYNTSGKEDGLILHVKVTMGYDVPWREVYDTLIKAASKTPHTETNPKPFVLQTGLDDFCANYELNVYTKEIERVPLIYSLLYQHIQDEFKATGVSMFIPHLLTAEINSVSHPQSIKPSPLGK